MSANHKVNLFGLVTRQAMLSEETMQAGKNAGKTIKKAMLGVTSTRTFKKQDGSEGAEMVSVLAIGYGDELVDFMASLVERDWVNLTGIASVAGIPLQGGAVSGRLDLHVRAARKLGHLEEGADGAQLDQFVEATIVGNLGADPEMRYTPAGVPVTDFRMATNVWLNGADTGIWFTVTAWRDLGERCAQYLAKGRLVAVEGSLRAEGYLAKDGTPKGKLVLTADDVKFLGGKEGGTGNGPAPEAREYSAGAGTVKASDPW